MRTTAIFSYKGGTGKTTTAINLGAELAAHGKRVVLIDADGQRNTSDFFGSDCSGATLYELLTGQEPYYENLLESARENLYLLPSSADLATVELDALNVKPAHSVRIGALCDLITAMAEDDAADYVLIDCPPSFAPQTVAALLASDDVIVPVTPDAWAVSGLRDVSVSLGGARRSNPTLRIAGVLLTKASATATARDAERALRQSGWPMFETAIRTSTWAERSSFERSPLRVCAHWTGICSDYAKLCEEYMEGVR